MATISPNDRRRERFTERLTVRLRDAAAAVGVSEAAIRNEIKAGRLEARERETKLPQALLLEASAALREPDPMIEELESIYRITRALSYAKAVQGAAEEKAVRFPELRKPDGKPNSAAIAQARRKVARDIGLSVAAMQARISRAFAMAPRVGWPEIMPRPPKKRRA